MRALSCFAVVGALAGCTGKTIDAGANGADAATRVAVYQSLVLESTIPSPVITCLTAPLPVGPSGAPNCVVVSARPLVETSEAGSDAGTWGCPCEASGLSAFDSSIPLSSIGEGLSEYSCLCSVPERQPSDASCPSLGSLDPDAGAFWCYTAVSDAGAGLSPCNSQQQPLGPAWFFGLGPIENPAGVVYVACFDPEAGE